MSGKASGWAWDQDLPQNLKFLLLCYADHADHEGANIYPSVDLVAQKTNWNRRTVQRLTRELEGLGFLIPVEDKLGGRGRSNRYRVPISGGEKGGAYAALSAAQAIGKGGTGRPKRAALEAQKGGTALPPERLLTVIEPLSNARPNGRARQPNEHDRLRKLAEEAFCQASKLKPPKLETAKQRAAAGTLWWAPLREICELVGWDEKRIKGLIQEAVGRMRVQKLTISSPKSILLVCEAILGEIRSGIFNPQGG